MKPAPGGRRSESGEKRVGLARALSKLGLCSRTSAAEMIRAGRVQVNGTVRRDPESPTSSRDRISVDGDEPKSSRRVYLMLNKPRGLVTTRSDEQGRPTVYDCFAGSDLPWVAPVGRLDRASEGLLLLTNDSAWADGVTAPQSHLEKTYHVQIDRLADEGLVSALVAGVVESGERLAAKSASVLRQGHRNSWLEITLDEGRNRQIRRMLQALGVEVLRLVRVRIGALELGELAKGKWRELSQNEVELLRPAAARESPGRSPAGNRRRR